MRQFLSLIKLELLHITKFHVLKQNKFKLVGILLLGLFLLISLGISFYDIYQSIFIVLQPLGFYIPIVFFYTSLLILMLTIFSSKSILFEIKEKDFFLSLPLTSKNIFLSRIFIILGISFCILLCSLVPALLVYINTIPVTFSFIIFFIIVSLFASIIPTVISCILGYFLGWILKHVRNKNLIENISYFSFFVIYFSLTFLMNDFIKKIASNADSFLTIMKFIFYPFYLLYKIFLYNDFNSLLLYGIINIFAIMIFILFFNKKYIYLLQKYNVVINKKQKEIKEIKSNNKKMALLKKEWSRYLNTPIYLFQFGLGLIILVITSIASFFIDFNILYKLGFNRLDIFFYLYFFTLSISNFACVSYSLEKNQFWILKVLPLKNEEIFDSKWQASWLFSIPFCVLSLILFVISGFLNLREAVILLMFSSVLTLFINVLGLVINILFPKLENVSDASIVKRSFSSFLGLMLPFTLLMILINIIKSINFISIILISLVLLILSFVFRKLGFSLLKKNKI